MGPLELINRTDDELKAWAVSEDPAVLEQTLEEIWQQIRDFRLYAGQPRSAESEHSARLARACLQAATYSGNGRLVVQACRMLAYSLTANEQYEESLPYHKRAIEEFEATGDRAQAARARLGYIVALTHAGKYREALAVASEAEAWFKENNDEVGFARVCNNVANLYDRIDEHERAYQYHLMHSEVVEKIGDQEGVAKSYHNLGICLAAMDQFEKADQMFQNCENLSQHLEIMELWAQAIYNRAHLHYLRGRYIDAFRSFNRLRQHFQQTGSRRHSALCDLDEAEIYIQLNRAKDAATLAQRAATQFLELGLHREEAEARAFLGLALLQTRKYAEALDAFETAQKIFEVEGNLYWIGLLDLYRSEVHLSLARWAEALALATQAKTVFERMGLPSKTILSLVQLGRLALTLDDIPRAEALTAEIAAIMQKTSLPLLLFPFYMLSAEIGERKEDWHRAERFYKLAADDLELHRMRLHHDDLKVTFLQGRNAAYEALVVLALRQAGQGQEQELAAAYMWCERAKSRGLVDLLSQSLTAIQGHTQSSLQAKSERLREELSVLYASSQPQVRVSSTAAKFETIAQKEDELTRILREVSFQDPEYTSLQQVSAATVETVQQMLPGDTTVIEYFIARDEVLVFVISRTGARFQRYLCRVGQIMSIQDHLAFQLEQFALGEQYLREHSDQIFEGTIYHLRQLYRYLFEPIRTSINTSHLTIVPHGCLHVLPFHAFTDGTRYITDDFEVSYAPSASVLKYCLEKNDIEDAQPCVIGVSDELAPFVEQEARSLASMFPGSVLLLNDAATRSAYAEAARRTSFLHIATHAVFRQDNPMFSGFKIAGGWVTAIDLFSMTCETNLVTLSGCQSGVSMVTGSDDVLGLIRGFLYAGARSLMVSLWNVDDRRTAELMDYFYNTWRAGARKSQALRIAMKGIREKYPNPFYWAPFLLIGKD